MKIVTMASNAAFPDADRRPTGEDLRGAIGAEAYEGWQRILAWLSREYSQVDEGWAFSPAVGWHPVPAVKKRRVLYLIPQRGGFELRLIVGDKALTLLKGGPYRRQVANLLKVAVRYPEGTAFSFNEGTFDPELVLNFVAAKLSH